MFGMTCSLVGIGILVFFVIVAVVLVAAKNDRE